MLRDGPNPELERLFDGIAPNAPLLFIPAAAGIVAHLDVVALHRAALAVAIVLGTAATLIVSGLGAQALLRRRPSRASP